MSRMGDDSQKDIPEEVIPEESIVEEEIVEEEVVEEGETENLEVTTPPVGRKPRPLGKLHDALNSIRPPKIRGPIDSARSARSSPRQRHSPAVPKPQPASRIPPRTRGRGRLTVESDVAVQRYGDRPADDDGDVVAVPTFAAGDTSA